MRQFRIYFGFLLLLGGCSTLGNQNVSIEEPSFEELIEHVHIVQSSNENFVFVDSTQYTYQDNIKLHTNQGESIAPKNIKAGSLIQYEDTGEIMESYPMQGTIKHLTLYDDDLSRQLEKGIGNFLKNYDMENYIKPQLVSLEGDELIIQFTDFNNTNDKYTATINIETQEFIVNDL
ncbi:hypothetical protein [Paenisporosarcina sp. TG20]|uniref:hypothetical protein n=1 Tax=Paenisporosarcina sp. TG20 TaxID=1211706 RepID=UPI0002D8BF8F|nr:hypothetical protein [Paenisporosarcina sp. TG20]